MTGTGESYDQLVQCTWSDRLLNIGALSLRVCARRLCASSGLTVPRHASGMCFALARTTGY